MTNPDNIVRVRARNGGRASVYEANGWAQSYSAGLFEGDGVIQNTVADMNVLVGGSSSKPDVVLAQNPAGYKIALDLVGQQPIAITAPASNNRISSIVAYTDDLSLVTTEDNVTGSPSTCGLIVVNGTASVNPTEPTDAQIRTAITSDGATGSQAAYVVIANILVSSNTTAITNSLIVTNRATLNVTNNIAPSSITANKLDWATSGGMLDQILANASIPQSITITSDDITMNITEPCLLSLNATFSASPAYCALIISDETDNIRFRTQISSNLSNYANRSTPLPAKTGWKFRVVGVNRSNWTVDKVVL